MSARVASLQPTSPTISSGSPASSVQRIRSTRVYGPSAIEEIKAATGGGVEFAFEMAGSVRAMDLAYKITRRGGTTVTAGLPPPDHTFALPQVNLVAEERTVKGSYIGTCVPTRDLPRYIELYRRGKLPVDRLMSGHLKLEEINVGFDRLHEGKAVRQVVGLLLTVLVHAGWRSCGAAAERTWLPRSRTGSSTR